MTEAFVSMQVNNGSGSVIARVQLSKSGVSYSYVTNAVNADGLIGAGADWIATVAYTPNWEPYIRVYKTADLSYSDSQAWATSGDAPGYALVSPGALAQIYAAVEVKTPPPQESYYDPQYTHAVSPNADVLYTLMRKDGVTYLLDTQLNVDGPVITSTRVVATTVVPISSFYNLRFENGELYVCKAGENSNYYHIDGGQFVAIDHTSGSQFSLANAPRYPSFGGASYDPDLDYVLSMTYPALAGDGAVLYGTNNIGDFMWVLVNGVLSPVPFPPYVRALSISFVYPTGGGQVVAPTGFWIDLTNTTQTTNAVIEFAPLHTVTVEDTAEMRLTLECEGKGGKTSTDTANMQLALRLSGLDATQIADMADMGFYLRPHISEGYTVVDNVRARLHLRAEGQSDFFTGLADPDIPDIGVCFFHVYQDKHLDGYYSADMPVLSFDVSTFAVSATPGVTPDFCSMEMHLEIPPALSRPWPPGATFRMHTGALHMHGWAGVPYEMAREKIEFHDASTTDQSIDTRSTVSLEAYARGRVRASVPMKTQVLFDDRLDGVYAELAESSLALDDVLLGDLLTTVYDRLLLTGRASSAAEARALVSSALALLAVADITPAEMPSDRAALSTAAHEAILLGGETFDRLVLRDQLPHSLVLVAAVRDTVRLDDEAALRAEIGQRLVDSLGLVAHLRLDGGHYTAWAMNTDSRATTRYQNYGFNSFMRVGGREYGASDAGLYRLEGDSDDGAPIQSHIRLGMSSLGSRLVKHVPDVYLGYSASGDLLLKAVISDSATGKREANVYRLVARGAASTREGRVKLGRGLNAVYWDFVIENVDGADFALDTIEFMPLAINRRLRGNAGAR